MLCPTWICLSLLVPLACGNQAKATEPYTFKLDGEVIHPTIISLHGTPDHPQAGDLVKISEMLLVLGPEKTIDLRRFRGGPGLILPEAKPGSPPICVSVLGEYHGTERVMVSNPFKKLTAKEIRGLRGVYLDAWNDEIAPYLKLLDPEHVCVTLTENAGKGAERLLPPLPTNLRYLCVEERSNRGMKGYACLRDFHALKHLEFHGLGEPVDARWLSKAKNLRYLDLSATRLENATELSALSDVISLNLWLVDGITNVSFLRHMPALVNLDLRRTRVTDLSPAAGHKALVSIMASCTPLRTLPQGELPALRTLDAFSTAVSDQAAADFARRHPKCRVLCRWAQAFREAAEGATRLRVRSGGTCHRVIGSEETLFEERDTAKIRKVLEHIAIDESQGIFECKCCGTPSLEFYKGEKLLVTLGVHHGQSVRWRDVWPGDGALTPDSADYLANWLAEHGIPGPLEALTSQRRTEEANKRRHARHSALIGKDLVAKLRRSQSPEAWLQVFKEGIPDGVARAELFLKLFGCDNGSWNVYTELDYLLQDQCLPSVSKAHFAEAIRRVKDHQAVNGAGRWLFGEHHWRRFDAGTIKAVLPVIGKQALGHPRLVNRRIVMKVLRDIKTTEAVALLRSVLAGEIKVRTLPPDDQEEPNGSTGSLSDEENLKKGSDQAFAALLLARLGDQTSLPRIRTLAASANPDDREQLARAVALLVDKQ